MHVNYTDIVSKIASGDWGGEFPSSKEAEQKLLADKQALGAFASLELLRRLECLASSLKGRKVERGSPKVHMPKNAAAMPHIKVGDRLFEYDVDEGLCEFIVIAKDSKHRCMIVLADYFDLESGPAVQVANEHAKTTVEDAMITGAQRHLEMWAGEVEFARKVVDAVEKKQSLDQFRGGFESYSEQQK